MAKKKTDIPPHSPETEMAVLGAMFLADGAFQDASDSGLVQDDFYLDRHRIIFQAMAELGQGIDLITVSEVLTENGNIQRIGGPAYLSELGDAVATTHNLRHHIVILKEKTNSRRMIELGREMMEAGYAGPGNGKTLKRIAEWIGNSGEHDFGTDKDAGVDLQGLIPSIKSLMSGSGYTGLRTGFRDIDRITGGFHASDLIVIAARPSMGKTALAANIILNVARDGNNVLFFSLEMGLDAIINRLTCSLAGIDLRDLRAGRLRGQEFARLYQAAQTLRGLPIWIDARGGLTVSEMLRVAEKLNRRKRLGLIAVDYIQLARGKAGPREQEVAEISRDVKRMAQKLDVPLIALSQLNRGLESRPDKRPQLSDLRESGAIEQDADLIAFIYREEVYHPDKPKLKGVAECIIRKQRNGPIGTVMMQWDARTTTFNDARWEND